MDKKKKFSALTEVKQQQFIYDIGAAVTWLQAHKKRFGAKKVVQKISNDFNCNLTSGERAHFEEYAKALNASAHGRYYRMKE